ncbi:hypothetical protein M9458_037675, partial [Cirrhinus mrigala]
APYWPAQTWFSDLISLLNGSPWEIPVRRHYPPPSPGVVEVVGVASEGAHLIASSLLTEVVETILQSRAPSTTKLKWRLFTSWCGHCQQDPVNCPVGTVLEFLQDRFSAGLAHSILKVYVAAISAYHALWGRNPLAEAFGQMDLKLLRHGHIVPHSVSPQLESLKGNVPGYVCNHGSLRERDTRLGPYFRHPCSACFSIQKLPAARTARAFKLPGLYVTPPVMSHFSIGLYAHVFRRVVMLEA